MQHIREELETLRRLLESALVQIQPANQSATDALIRIPSKSLYQPG